MGEENSIFSFGTNLTHDGRGKDRVLRIGEEIRVCGEIGDKTNLGVWVWKKLGEKINIDSGFTRKSPTPYVTHGDLDSGFTLMKISPPIHASHRKV